MTTLMEDKWDALARQINMPKEDAMALFARFVPLKSSEERYQVVKKVIEDSNVIAARCARRA